MLHVMVGVMGGPMVVVTDEMGVGPRAGAMDEPRAGTMDGPRAGMMDRPRAGATDGLRAGTTDGEEEWMGPQR
jgi:hypothetical protein